MLDEDADADAVSFERDGTAVDGGIFTTTPSLMLYPAESKGPDAACGMEIVPDNRGDANAPRSGQRNAILCEKEV